MWAQAREAMRDGLPTGLFRGVPMPLKDLGQYYQGVVTSNGSRLFADNIADHDSTLVQRYKAAGLVLSGKTNTPEFGLATTTEPVLHGPTRNPWSIDHSTGGSSGGAAAAVAAGIFRSPTLQTAADLFVFQPVAADSSVLNPPADGCHWDPARWKAGVVCLQPML